MDAAKLPPSVRMKVASPDPAAISCGSRSDNRMVSTGMKNSATPNPCNSWIVAMDWKSTPRLKYDRAKLVIAIATNARLATSRRSKRCAYLPTNGVSSTGRMPMGAVAKPAQIAV